ncbi:hypothetical protein ABEY69_00535 [Priestia filamentosa]|uniref:hypothetical protein n=1 Tax=Priestia filamentosa TaxID=1402861 RepID=UPI003D2C569D
MRKKLIVFSSLTLLLSPIGFATQADAFSSSTPITPYGSTGSPDDPDNFIKLINDVPDHSMSEFNDLGYDKHCYLTAMTNLILHWDHRYTSLVQYKKSPPDQDRVMNRIAYFLNYDNKGTSNSEAKYALQSFITEKGLSNKLAIRGTSVIGIKEIEKQLYKGNPILLTVDDYTFNGVVGVNPEIGHVIVVTGIIRVGEKINLIVQDGWGSTSKSIILDWNNIKEDMSIDYMLYIEEIN